MVADFFYNYFVKPILFKEGFNPVNTAAYSFILLLVSIYIIFPLLRKLKVKIDRRLAIAIFPFIVFGSSMRVLVDAKLIEFSFFLITPLIYVVIFLLTFSFLLISIFFEKKLHIDYYKIMFTIGLFLISIPISLLTLKNVYGLLLVLLFFSPWFLFFTLFKKWNIQNRLVSIAHMFDATTTSVSIYFFPILLEQHFLSAFFITTINPFSFIFVKLVGIVLALTIIDKFSEDKEYANFLKLILGILGAATSIRDFIAVGILL